MKQAVRIIAECVADENYAADSSYTLVCDVMVQGEKIERNRYFGVVSDGGERFPFILEPMSGENTGGVLHWGDFTDEKGTPYEDEPITLFDRPVKVGE